MKPNGFGVHPRCTDDFVAWCADVIDALRALERCDPGNRLVHHLRNHPPTK